MLCSLLPVVSLLLNNVLMYYTGDSQGHRGGPLSRVRLKLSRHPEWAVSRQGAGRLPQCWLITEPRQRSWASWALPWHDTKLWFRFNCLLSVAKQTYRILELPPTPMTCCSLGAGFQQPDPRELGLALWLCRELLTSTRLGSLSEE